MPAAKSRRLIEPSKVLEISILFSQVIRSPAKKRLVTVLTLLWEQGRLRDQKCSVSQRLATEPSNKRGTVTRPIFR